MTEPSRVLYAMARDKLIPKVFGFINKKHQTPWAALLILAAIPPILLIPYLENSSANHAIGNIISSDGMIGLFMYFVVSLASVWFYRDHLKRSPGKFLILGIVPLLGGLFMGAIFGYGLTTQAHVVAWVAVIILVIVFALGFIIHLVRPNSPYFTDLKDRRARGVQGSDESNRTHGS
jgi:amino acid transporter